MSLLEACSPRLLDMLCLDAIDHALHAPTLAAVYALQDYSGTGILRRAENFGAVAAITVGRAEASALRMRELELLEDVAASVQTRTILHRAGHNGQFSQDGEGAA